MSSGSLCVRVRGGSNDYVGRSNDWEDHRVGRMCESSKGGPCGYPLLRPAGRDQKETHSTLRMKFGKLLCSGDGNRALAVSARMRKTSPKPWSDSSMLTTFALARRTSGLVQCMSGCYLMQMPLGLPLGGVLR